LGTGVLLGWAGFLAWASWLARGLLQKKIVLLFFFSGFLVCFKSFSKYLQNSSNQNIKFSNIQSNLLKQYETSFLFEIKLYELIKRTLLA
jgi:hypothetical protein